MSKWSSGSDHPSLASSTARSSSLQCRCSKMKKQSNCSSTIICKDLTKMTLKCTSITATISPGISTPSTTFMTTRHPRRKSIKIQPDCQYVPLWKVITQPFLPMGKPAPAKPTPWKVLSTVSPTRPGESSPEPSKISSDSSKDAKIKMYLLYYLGHLHGQSFLHSNLQLDRQRFAQKRQKTTAHTGGSQKRSAC